MACSPEKRPTEKLATSDKCHVPQRLDQLSKHQCAVLRCYRDYRTMRDSKPLQHYVTISDRLRILTYKRTHIGDPDEYGRFGIYDCMGRIRSYAFDAVIGVGGIGPEPKRFGIDRKINWVGVTPTRQQSPGGTGVEVIFENFLLLEESGPLLMTLAPCLAKRMYEGGARIVLNDYSPLEHKEAVAILKWSLRHPPPAIREPRTKVGCQSKCRLVAARKASR